MRGNGASLKPSLRETLATSRIGAVAIAVLLFLTLDFVFNAFWTLLSPLEDYLVNATAFILGIPFSQHMLFASTLFESPYYLLTALVTIAAASLLSRWLYGGGPIRVLRTYRALLNRRNHA